MKRFLLTLFFSAAAIATDFGWREPRRPIEIKEPLDGVQVRSAETCRNCHSTIYEQWSRSRHRVAWTNPIFQDGFHFEPSTRCVHCHAPLKEQFDAIQNPTHAPSPNLAHEGINCVVCHVREGKVFGVHETKNALHSYRATSELSRPEFCAGCHQFEFHRVRDGNLSLTGIPMQNTYGEWREYVKRGGDRTCQNCHMPDGRHEFPGANDRNFLRKALEVRAGENSITLKSVGVGHEFPTGDLFRYLTLEVAPLGGSFTVVKKFRRNFTLVVDPKNGQADKVPTENHSLKPFRPETLSIPEACGKRYRVRYHYASEQNEARATLPDNLLYATVSEGKFPCSHK